MFKLRLFSSIILIIIMSFSIFYGGYLLIIVLILISLFGMLEFYNTITPYYNNIIKYNGYLCIIIYYLINIFFENEFLSVINLLLILILSMYIYIYIYNKFSVEQISTFIFSFLYIPVTISYVYIIRNLKFGIFTIIIMFLSAWVNDTFAYCIGKLIGKNKIFKILSPKKTFEGMLAGILYSIFFNIIYINILIKINLNFNKYNIYILIIIFFINSIFSILGDLIASAIKRNKKIKNYGNMIPGHGGILDRFDSVIAVIPIIYFINKIYLK